METLLRARKLSLVIDLDQTVLHAVQSDQWQEPAGLHKIVIREGLGAYKRSSAYLIRLRYCFTMTVW